MKNIKPLGRKSYGSIPHLPGSRRGASDKGVHEGQNRICTEKTRDRHDVIIVQEKLDGSNCAVANIDGMIVPLIRSGYVANTSKYEQHHLFYAWVMERQARFLDLLNPGERCVGEWLAQAHGTIYELWHEPYVIFDIMRDTKRETWDAVSYRCSKKNFITPGTIHIGSVCSIANAMNLIGSGYHGALGGPEGVVWRVERRGKVDFLAKYVRPDKIDGCYLPEYSGKQAIWNWRP